MMFRVVFFLRKKAIFGFLRNSELDLKMVDQFHQQLLTCSHRSKCRSLNFWYLIHCKIIAPVRTVI